MRSWWKFADQRLENRTGRRGLSNLVEPHRRGDSAPYSILHRCLRREVERVPGQFGCGSDRRASGRFARRLLDLSGHALVHAGHTERTVTGTLDSITHHGAQLPVHRSDADPIGFVPANGRQQRMLELNQFTCTPNHSGPLDLSQTVGATDFGEGVRRRAGKQRRGQQRPASRS
jgi:hypothetical protein